MTRKQLAKLLEDEAKRTFPKPYRTTPERARALRIAGCRRYRLRIARRTAVHRHLAESRRTATTKRKRQVSRKTTRDNRTYLLSTLTPAERLAFDHDVAKRLSRGERWTESKALKYILRLRDIAAKKTGGG